MYQIIIGVLAIGMMALLVAGGINYINLDRMNALAAASQFEAESAALRSALHAFVVANGYLPGADRWEEELKPYLAPAARAGQRQFQWSFGTDVAGGPWICASHPEASPALLAAVDRISMTRQAEFVMVSRQCADGPATPVAGDPVAVTLFLGGGYATNDPASPKDDEEGAGGGG